MEQEHLQLIAPDESLVGEFQSFCAEFPDPQDIHGIGSMNPKDPAGSVQLCRDNARGIGLRPGFVPSTTLWLVRDGQTLLGTIHLRHSLTPWLENEGGHIGYAVRPSQQGKGYATRMLSMCLEKARAMGLARVLITCDRENKASARVIIKNGGVLENEVASKIAGRAFTLRYWIALE